MVGVKPNHQTLGPLQLLHLCLGELITGAGLEKVLLQFVLPLMELQHRQFRRLPCLPQLRLPADQALLELRHSRFQPRADSKFQPRSDSGCRRAIASSAVMSCITACNPVRID